MLSGDFIKLNSKNTLSEIVEKFRGFISDENFGELSMLHRTFMMTFKFLPEIWNRIVEDVELEVSYGDIYADLYAPGGVEREPTGKELEILKAWRKYRYLLNLDVEDWFIHSFILMDKYAKLAKRLTRLFSQKPDESKLIDKIPHKNFYRYKKYYLNTENQRFLGYSKYTEIVRKNTDWYVKELKDVRDDLIQHENIPKFWGYSISRNKIRLSRFRHSRRLREKIEALKDKYKKVFPQLEGEKNFFKLMDFFEKNISHMDEKDITKLKDVKKMWGGRFPDIPKLFGKMSKFFSLVNDHFVQRFENEFKKTDPL